MDTVLLQMPLQDVCIFNIILTDNHIFAMHVTVIIVDHKVHTHVGVAHMRVCHMTWLQASLVA